MHVPSADVQSFPGRNFRHWHCGFLSASTAHVIHPGKPGPASFRTEVLVSFVVHVSVANFSLRDGGAGPMLDTPPFSDGLGTVHGGVPSLLELLLINSKIRKSVIQSNIHIKVQFPRRKTSRDQQDF